MRKSGWKKTRSTKFGNILTIRILAQDAIGTTFCAGIAVEKPSSPFSPLAFPPLPTPRLLDFSTPPLASLPVGLNLLDFSTSRLLLLPPSQSSSISSTSRLLDSSSYLPPSRAQSPRLLDFPTPPLTSLPAELNLILKKNSPEPERSVSF
jgi:hypothetical protein